LGWIGFVRIYVQYPVGSELRTEETEQGRRFSLDGRRFFHALVTERGLRVDSQATMGRRRYYYGKEVTLRFGRKFRPLVTARGHPSPPVGFLEMEFEI
jgi:hypothetical protein